MEIILKAGVQLCQTETFTSKEKVWHNAKHNYSWKDFLGEGFLSESCLHEEYQ